MKDVEALASKVAAQGGFDLICHDNQWRTLLTALVYHAEMPRASLVNVGMAGQSQALGGLEGQFVDVDTIATVQYYTEHPDERPPGISAYATRPADTFNEWAGRWFGVVGWLQRQAELGKRVAIVTHNRNVHAMSSLRDGRICPDLMNQPGPLPNTVHVLCGDGTHEWDGEWIRPGVYFIRHAETAWNQ